MESPSGKNQAEGLAGLWGSVMTECTLKELLLTRANVD